MSTEKERTEASHPQPTSATPATPPHVPGDMPSINEPAGSNVVPPPPEVPKDAGKASHGVTKNERGVSHETSELPPDAELERMTRAELDSLAEQRGVDISHANNKDDVITALRKDARKRHR